MLDFFLSLAIPQGKHLMESFVVHGGGVLAQ
jgi:hypothetical protein